MSNMYKRECIISTRTDVRILAGLADFYKKKGVLARTKSSLVGDAIEDFALFLESKELLKVPETVVEALDILKQSNFSFIGRDRMVSQRGIVKDLADEHYKHISKEMESLDEEMSKKVGRAIAGK